MKKLELKDIQYEEKEMLKKLIIFLEKEGINYYIWAGSFLGTIRHKGFIPWDDDVDIAIPREDYDKLLHIIKEKKKINNNLEFIGFELDKVGYPFLKVINKKIEISQKINVDKYLWIDIFPLDCVPQDIKEAKKFLKKVFIKHQLISLKFMKYKDVFRSSKTITRKIVKILIRPFLIFMNLERFTEKYIRYCKKYNNKETNTICNVIWNNSNKDFFDKNLLKDSKYQFEDITVNGIEDYNKILTILYGDYMKLPPIEKRFTHSFDAYYKD